MEVALDIGVHFGLGWVHRNGESPFMTEFASSEGKRILYIN